MSSSQSPPQSGGVQVRIRALLPSLRPAEQRVAEHILGDPGGAPNLTITELAHACGTSETTVIRFCRAIGFDGYPGLRLALASDAGREASSEHTSFGGDISPSDDLADVVRKVTWHDARAIEDTANQVDVDTLQRVVDAVAAAGRVDLYGVGASAFVALDLQQKLYRIGRHAFAWSDTHVMLTSAAILHKGDVAFAISHSGETTDTIDALTEAKRHKATTVALTNFPRSRLAQAADLVLSTAARETTFRSGATASRIAQLSIIDCVFVGVAQRTYDDTRSALKATSLAVQSRRGGEQPRSRRGGRKR
ncbi:MAG: MurR/RpiR family transcriptional regulator [Streptosporangiales bacterium]|nr:MurR/RpiR family transcriptional regulator [Streptosporangiales bacterium]MBO0890673.1 MurR/RpiR family transcriptional regulator [Acidothermales bacterium]